MESSWQDAFCQFLHKQGFPIAKKYESGQILFRCEGNHYLAQFHPNIPERFALALPAFWELEDAAEETRALAAANTVNLRVFGTTVVCADQTVWALAELFLANPAKDLKKVFNSALKAVQLAANTFVTLMLNNESGPARPGNGAPVAPRSDNGTQHTAGYL